MSRNLKKVVALTLVLIMLFANMLVLGSNVVMAENVETTSRTTTKKGEVSFDAYFSSEAKNIHSNNLKIGEDNNIISSIKVEEEGYIQEGKITIGNSNFKFGEVDLSQVVQSSSDTEIVINRINSNDKEIQITIPVKFNKTENVKAQDFNKINDVKFSGIFVNKEGKETNIEATVQLQVMWEATATPILESNVTKYVPFNLGNSRGIILQEEIKAGVEENILPIGKEEIKISVPTINGIAPIEVKVTGANNFNYNAETKTLIINNDRIVDSNGNIAWEQEADIFNVTYKYDDKAFNSVGPNGFTTSFNGELKLSVYKNVEEELTKNYTNGLLLKDPISSIVGFEISSKENISKGYMYANFDKTSGKNETEYKEIVKVTVGDIELTDSVSVTLNADKLGNTINLAEKVKTITVKEDNLRNVLGDDGKIDIYSGEELIGSLNSTNLAIDLTANNVNEGLTLKLSKPTAVGNLEIEVLKGISGEQNFSKEELQQETTITSSVTGVAYSGNFEFINETKTTNINMTEPTTEALLSFDNTTLSTIVRNENVKIKAILRNDSLNNKLFKNPLINITLPDCVTNIELRSVDVLYDNELVVTGYEVQGKTIVVQLEGTQTNYNLNSISLGTNVVITASITVDKLTTTQYPEITMVYVNDGERLETSEKLPIIAPVGLVTVNEVKEANDTYTALIGDPQTVMLDTNATTKNITVEGKVINNYENPISSIKIVGEVPNKDLNSNMNGAISLDTPVEAKTYYSTKESPSNDLSKSDNEWRETPEDLTKVKSYMIVLDNLIMNQGDSLGFSYGATIGEGLDYNQEGKAKYSVYFDNNLETGKVEDKAISENVIFTTGIKINLSAELTSNIEEGSLIHDGDFIDLTAQVTNNENTVVKGVSVDAIAPNGNVYKYNDNGTTKYTMDQSVEGAIKVATVYSTIVQYDGTDKNNPEKELGEFKSFKIGELAAGQSKKASYTLRIDNISLYDDNNDFDLPIIANIDADKLESPFATNEVYLKTKSAEFYVKNTSSVAQEDILGLNTQITYTTRVDAKATTKEYKDFNIEYTLPNGISILEATITGKDGMETLIGGNTARFSSSSFTDQDYVEANVKVELTSAIGSFSPDIRVYADGTDEYTGNKLVNGSEEVDVIIEQKQLDNQYIKEGEEVTFTFNILNNGNSNINKLTFVEEIPEEFTYKSAELQQFGETMPVYGNIEDGNLSQSILNLSSKASARLDLTMIANRIPDGKNQISASNEASIVEEKSGTEIKSNPVNTIIEYSEENHNSAPIAQGGDGSQINYYNQYENANPGTYKISGTAWIDANKDGTMNTEEAKLPGIRVIAVNQEDVSKVYSTTTSNEGTYEFNALPTGKYIVAFQYDSSKHTVTTYKASGVAESINNDTISGQTTIDGTLQTVAISDILTLNGDNVRNINLGVYDSRISDLSLDKIVGSITVSNATGTADYKYEGNNRKFAKRELTPKYVDSTNLLINYEITVKNEGNVTEYVRKIADYLPNGLTFNEGQNSGWYKAQDGLLINDSLANVPLNPGEEKTVKLVLSLNTSNDKLGIIDNTAEIYESYNEEGIKDVDSTVANKAAKEDDYSSADVILAIRTGAEAGMFIGLSLVILVIVGAGAYLIKKKAIKG